MHLIACMEKRPPNMFKDHNYRIIYCQKKKKKIKCQVTHLTSHQYTDKRHSKALNEDSRQLAYLGQGS